VPGDFLLYVLELEMEKTARPADDVFLVRRRLPAMSLVLAFVDFLTDFARVVRTCWRLFFARSCDSASVVLSIMKMASNNDELNVLRYVRDRCT
jgi:hypothetical protein